MRSFFSDTQWLWVADRYREGYTIGDLALFLGIHRNSVHRGLIRYGVIPPDRRELPSLRPRRAEFVRLDRRRGGGQADCPGQTVIPGMEAAAGLGAGQDRTAEQAVDAGPGVGAGLDNPSERTVGAGLDNPSERTVGAGLDNPSERTVGAGLDNPSERTVGAGLDNPSKRTFRGGQYILPGQLVIPGMEDVAGLDQGRGEP